MTLEIVPISQQEKSPRDKMREVYSNARLNGYQTEAKPFRAMRDGYYEPMLFSHAFAKATFGEKPIEWPYAEFTSLKFFWQMHIQDASISESPLDYYYNYVQRPQKAASTP